MYEYLNFLMGDKLTKWDLVELVFRVFAASNYMETKTTKNTILNCEIIKMKLITIQNLGFTFCIPGKMR
jgi:hypothetical protein